MRLFLLFLLGISCHGLFAQVVPFSRMDDARELLDFEDKAAMETQIALSIGSPWHSSEKLHTAYGRFASQHAFYIESLVAGKQLYGAWDDLENYLNEVLQLVAPDSIGSNINGRGGQLYQKDMIHAYVMKDPQYNAGMTATGQMLVYIGMIAEAESEAVLAANISHELAHFYYVHGFNTFLERYLGSFTKNEVKWAPVNSQNQELEADLKGFNWMMDSDYELEGFLKSFRYMQKQEQKWVRQSGRISNNSKGTHPTSVQRLEQINSLYEKAENTGRKAFIIKDEPAFLRLRSEARKETLKWYLVKGDYTSVVERAFKYHVQDPQEEAYVYFIMEGLRRAALVEPGFLDFNFYTCNYKKSIENGAKNMADWVTTPLLASLDNGILGWSAADIKGIKAKHLWEGGMEFKTNLEAFDYFAQLALNMKCIECYFSNALFDIDSDERRIYLLEKYLDSDKGVYQPLARYLMGQDRRVDTSAQRMVVFSDFDFSIKVGQQDIPVQLSDTNADFQLFIEDLSKETSCEAVYLPQMIHEDFQMAFELSTMESTAMICAYFNYNGQNVSPLLLDPSYYTSLSRLGVKAVDFVSVDYCELRKNKRDQASFEAAENMGYREIFDTEKRSRYLTVRVIGVEYKNTGWKSAFTLDRNVDFKFKDPGRPQMLKILGNSLARHRARLKS